MRAAAPAPFDDDAARARIRASLGESLLVEAAAGTGKTSEMVRRIVAVLAAGRARIQQVVAVTFTRKAAGELKLRLRQALDGARAEAPEASPERASLEDALARLEEAHVGTIHSFCAEILRERPVEAVVDPAFQELSDPEARRLYARAFREWAQDKLAGGAPGLRRALGRLARLDHQDPRPPLERLQQDGWKLIEWRGFPASWRREPFDRPSEIDALVLEVQSLAAQATQCPYKSDALVQALRPAQDLATWIDRAERGVNRDHDALEGLLIQLLRDLRRHKKKGKGTFAPHLRREEVVAARDRLAGRLEHFQRRADADLAALLRAEMGELVPRYDDIKRRAGGLDFVDLLVKVRDLLRQNPEVRRFLQRQFSHIFVDEFQDTDPLQAEILILLSADDPEQTDWLEVTPVPGKLFVVGDPKQSIYRFRRADVLLYQQVRSALTARGVGLVHLSQSFRAVRPLQECINAAFEPEFQEDPETGQPQYVPLEPPNQDLQSRDPQGAVPTVIALPAPHPYGYQGVSKDQVKRCLPASIAEFIDWLLHRSEWTVRHPDEPAPRVPLKERHICLLFRHYISYFTDTTREYLHALEARGIAHVLVGQRSFHQREEVETLRSALAAVEWPDDELSVYATLRGPLFGISDAVLFRFRETIGTLHPFRPAPENLEGDLQPITQALDLLHRLHGARNHRPIVETLHELLEATRAHAGFALRPAGHQVLANVHRIADLARNYELTGGISFRGFVEELEAQAERPSGAESPAVEEAAEGVRLMTAHTAKGLEFPVVILADVTTRLAWDRPDMYIDSRRGLCAMPLIGCQPWDLLEHQAEEAARDQAEGVRVAYVAATRARDLLVVPAVGDEPLGDSWVAPLHKALYPDRQNRRRSQPAPGCPPFGESTVLSSPPDYHGGEPFSIRPGLHQPERGTHAVVWWDPALWNLKREGGLGLRLETVLAEDAGGAAAARGQEQHQAWKQARSQAVRQGSKPRIDLFAATRAPETPPGPDIPIEVQATPRAPGRPGGAQFGALVHTLLRDADFDADRDALASLARSHARVLGSPPDHLDAAIEAVAQTLLHPLLDRARRAGRLHREWPLVFRLEDDRVLEGVLDLAFLEDDSWTIVDFKSDADLEPRRVKYERQLQWYVYALARLTGQPARGILLSV
jgi:ATP-dependent exoDNAse (exonuclease V) beta subunit